MVQDELPEFAGVGGCGWGSAWTGDRQYTASGDLYSQKLAGDAHPRCVGAEQRRRGHHRPHGHGDLVGQGQFTSTFATGESAGRTLKLLKVSSMASVYDDAATARAWPASSPRRATGAAWAASPTAPTS
jgi:hypothetical protein